MTNSLNETIKNFRFDQKLTESKITKSEAARDSVTGDSSFLSQELIVVASDSYVTEKLE